MTIEPIRNDDDLKRVFRRLERIFQAEDGAAQADERDVLVTLVEAYPSLWKHAFPADDRTPDQHDAFTVASWLSEADRSGQLARYLQPNRTPAERTVAGVEGWILGVG